MTTEATTQTTVDQLLSSSPRVERAVENLVSIARLWTTQGLEVGRSALIASAESLKLVAETLADAKARVSGEVVAGNLLVRSGAVVGPAEGGTLRLEVSGALTVETGGKLDVTGKGYAGGVTGAPMGEAPSWVTGSTSARTGVSPAWMVALTVAQNVIGVVMTSLPGSRLAVTMLTCSAAVQELTPATCAAPTPW